MNAVGIDISKGKRTIIVMCAFGEVVASPYDVGHTENELKELTSFSKSLLGELRVLMEYIGRYYEPIRGISMKQPYSFCSQCDFSA